MKKYTFDAVIAAIGSFFTFLFGAWDMPLIVLLVFIVLDYLTGLACAVIHKNVSSEIGAKGLLKKAMIMVVLIVSVLLDRLIGSEWIVRSSVCSFYIVNEAISVIENAGVLELSIPQKLLDVLAQLHDKGNKDDDEK